MSMITEQIKRLKNEADLVECTHDYTAKLLREAADTIKTQSAKIHAYAMERSTAYYREEVNAYKKAFEDIRAEIRAQRSTTEYDDINTQNEWNNWNCALDEALKIISKHNPDKDREDGKTE